jgi:hypothetical protein
MIDREKSSTSDRMPPPHPTSITLRPLSGLDEYGSLLDIRICTVSQLVKMNKLIVSIASQDVSVYSANKEVLAQTYYSSVIHSLLMKNMRSHGRRKNSRVIHCAQSRNTMRRFYSQTA